MPVPDYIGSNWIEVNETKKRAKGQPFCKTIPEFHVRSKTFSAILDFDFTESSH